MIVLAMRYYHTVAWHVGLFCLNEIRSQLQAAAGEPDIC